jgi:hypothetical protein
MEKWVDFEPGKRKANKALPINQCLTNKNFAVFDHSPYSPDLASCEFYIFPKDQVRAQKNQFRVGRKFGNKNFGNPKQHFRT